MSTILKVDKSLNTPVYLQIIHSVYSRIEDGSLSLGSQMPSINQVAIEYSLARETVVKAFKILQGKGIISPVQGKGYFVSSTELNIENRIFLFFDSFSAYKEVIYNALKDQYLAQSFILHRDNDIRLVIPGTFADELFEHPEIIMVVINIDEGAGSKLIF